MADAKLLCEIVHAVLNGITTTNASKLDSLYKRFDDDFEREAELSERLLSAFDFLLTCEDIHSSTLMKPFSVYSLVLAISHTNNPVDELQAHFEIRQAQEPNKNRILQNLTLLADVLEDPESASQDFKAFVDASTSKTNVARERITRFQWYCRALTERLTE